MPADTPDPVPPTAPGSLRSRTGRGRPYPAQTVAAVRALALSTALRLEEIGVQTGLRAATVGRWVRRFGWRGEGGEAGPDRAARHAPPASRGAAVARYRRYGLADREAARAAIEGSRASMERIERDLGISSATLARWKRAGRWRRPGPLDGRARPNRYKIMPGRPYAADAVEAVRRLVIGSELSNQRIAERVGIAPVTVSRMIRRRGWERPPARPGSPRARASKRTAPIRQSGDRRGRPYTAETVAAARELFVQTRLPVATIAARVRVGPDTVYRWKAAGGWTRPHHLPDTYGRPRRARRR